jgi:hypothetical protein
MNLAIHSCVFLVPGQHSVAEVVSEKTDTSASLEVNVIFTNERRARVALKFAGRLAQNLNAHINLLVVKEVPLAFPLDRPPVPISFTMRRFFEFVNEGLQGPMETTVRLYYCRNRPQALVQALEPKSLVILGGRETWWPTLEGRLGTMLRAKGHQLIFAANR